jgi:large subunit ribosomal protein L13
MIVIMSTTLAKAMDIENKQWLLFDATAKILGRLAIKIANILRGRDKPIYTPHMDMGDFVIVINAEKVKRTGNTENDKEYMFYSGSQG